MLPTDVSIYECVLMIKTKKHCEWVNLTCSVKALWVVRLTRKALYKYSPFTMIFDHMLTIQSWLKLKGVIRNRGNLDQSEPNRHGVSVCYYIFMPPFVWHNFSEETLAWILVSHSFLLSLCGGSYLALVMNTISEMIIRLLRICSNSKTLWQLFECMEAMIIKK